jgi:16S rRNA G966 N2-methylase RsmD
MNPKVRECFQKLIPPLAPEEFDQLEVNILADGCRDPLVVWDGVLIDGHNRLAICQKQKLPFATREIRFENDDFAKLWIIDNQKGRRNVSEIDRIALQKEREKIVARQAKGNQLANLKKGSAVPAKLPKREKLDTRKACAAAAGVGERTYDAGKLILDAAEKGEVTPETVDEVRRGKKAIHRVAKDIKEARGKKSRQEKRNEAAKSAPASEERIIISDFRKRCDSIADGSVSLIFTDPPYDRQASKMLPDLAKFAAAKLCDGGSILCYVGQTQIPTALDALRLNLRYWWTIACMHSGKSTVMREYGINAGWKAVLWFVKGTRDDNSVMVSDVMSGGQEKAHHDWQQAESEAAYWIEKLCPKDGLICDPFLGSGTTAAAAERLGRKWIGFEIDPDTAKLAAKRIKDAQ